MTTFNFRNREYSVNYTDNGIGVIVSSAKSTNGFTSTDQAISAYTHPEMKKKLQKAKSKLAL